MTISKYIVDYKQSQHYNIHVVLYLVYTIF